MEREHHQGHEIAPTWANPGPTGFPEYHRPQPDRHLRRIAPSLASSGLPERATGGPEHASTTPGDEPARDRNGGEPQKVAGFRAATGPKRGCGDDPPKGCEADQTDPNGLILLTLPYLSANFR